MRDKKILIIDEMHSSIVSLLEHCGWSVDYQPMISRKDILSVLGSYTGLIIRSKTIIDKELIGAAKNLRFVGRAGAGLDLIDIEELERRNILLFHAAEGNMDAVAEHALGGLLALFNRLTIADAQVRKGIWKREENRGVELKGKTVGIIGYGNMGSSFAKRLKGFDVKVLVYDKYKSGFGDEFIIESALEDLFDSCDVLSVHVPLTLETQQMITKEFLRKFKKAIYFINTARGELVTFDTLNWAMDEGIVKGAVLDVLENEKFQNFTQEQKAGFQKLASRDEVVFTPHVAGWTFESYEKINKVLVEKIQKSLG